MKRLSLLLCALLAAGCASDEENIQAWMAEQEKGLRGAVKPLPDIRPFPPVHYQAEAHPDPFSVARLEPETRTVRRGGPDLDRRREPLEAYPLESLQLVGAIRKGNTVHALVKADSSLHQVRVGNYVGQNFGVVTHIGDTEITLRELVEDVNGDWVERTSKLLLQERENNQ